ncbi:MAG TPA: Mur ligase family protein [Candidatus Paceibacterota bacterium]|nr:Mur ligase family protein [Candidatus Paceibacterota bacterium]
MISHVLSSYLAFWARRHLARTGIRIIAITGNVGKTTTKEAVGAALSPHLAVRVVRGNFNAPFGVAVGILGGGWDDKYYESGGGAGYWFRAACAAPLLALFSRPKEKFVVAEYGADRPGDIGWLAERFPPHVAVVTAVGQIPVHVEYFASAREVAREKAKILRYLKSGDHAVLNTDDLSVLEMREGIRALVTTFGMRESAEVRAAGLQILSDSGVAEGMMLNIQDGRASAPVRLYGALGRSQAYAAAAAVAVGKALGLTLEQAVAGLSGYRPPAGRMRLLRGVKETTILDDSYNSSPSAVHNALDILKAMPAPSGQARKIAVLGDMLELGGKTITAHQAAGDMAGSIADILVCVGDKSKFTADSAGNQLPSANIKWYRTSEEARVPVQAILRPGDVVLVKGSQGMRMERIVKEIMADPEHAVTLLVRQNQRWLRTL